MNRIVKLRNVIQEYAWGSYTAIPTLTASPVNPANRPQAELWMGAHPKAPSSLQDGDRQISLLEAINQSPKNILGPKIADKFNDRLPYLFKVLAAASPLSIQAHPNLEQALKGFARENSLGIALDAKNRNYKDDNHKPEIICALTPFWALNGFRKTDDMVNLLTPIASPPLQAALPTLKTADPQKGLKDFFKRVMTLPVDDQNTIANDTVSYAQTAAPQTAEFDWIKKLAGSYPGDIGLLSPILLNLVCLSPGEAMFLPAGQLHAYLDGLGIELMANSDNVLRGGLTPKHIDVPELLDVLRFEETPIDILKPEKTNRLEGRYNTPAEEFTLSIITLRPGEQYQSASARSAEIILCTEGKVQFGFNLNSPETLSIHQGESVLVPAVLPGYTIEGQGTLYKAAVPWQAP